MGFQRTIRAGNARACPPTREATTDNSTPWISSFGTPENRRSPSIDHLLLVNRDPGITAKIPDPDQIAVSSPDSQATRLACQSMKVQLDAGEEDDVEVVFPADKHAPWMVVLDSDDPLLLDITRTAFDDSASRRKRGHVDHGLIPELPDSRPTKRMPDKKVQRH